MTEIFKNSFIFSKLSSAAKKIAVKWGESQIGWYFTRNFNDIKTRNSVAYKIINNFVNKVFVVDIGGKFGKKLKESVFLNAFSHYEYGVYAMLFLAPIIPTMACVALALATFVSFFIKGLVKNDMKITFDSFGISVILLAVLFFIYSLTSFAMVSSLKIFAIYVVFVGFMFLVIACGSNKKRLKTMVCSFITSGLIVSLYGIYQNFFGSNVGHAWIDEEMFSDISIRVYSTFGNPNVLGEFLLLLIPICGAMIYGAKKWYSKVFFLGVLACAGVCLIFTQSRGCWVGIILAAAIFAFLIDKRLLGLGIVALLFAPMILPESIMNRFLSIGNLGDSSTSYRVNIWSGTVNMLKDYWSVGIGLGSDAFNMVYPFYSYSAVVALHSHNLFLQIFAEMGVVGILTFVTSMAIALKKILVGYIVGRKNFCGMLCGGVLAGLFGFLLEGMFDNVWYNHRVFAIFWMVIGIGIAARRCACEEDNTRNQ